MHKDLFIFDLDGTLMDAYQAIWASLTHTLDAFGYPPVDYEVAKHAVGMGDKHFVTKFFKPADVEQARRIYRDHHLSIIHDKVFLMPGAGELLAFLTARGKFLAVASNRPRETGRSIIRQLDIEHYFQRVVFADMVARPKPSPDVVEAITSFFGAARQQALFVGDMDIDVNTGKNAGVDTVAVATGSSSHEELKACGPDCLCLSLHELLAELKNGRF
jgi:phosphoglycolate phosphatase